MMTRTITIVCQASGAFDVFEGERYQSHLCWDEMLGLVAELTHPKIVVPRHALVTTEEHMWRHPWLMRPTSAEEQSS